MYYILYCILAFAVSKWAGANLIAGWILRFFSRPLADIMGDVTLYCSMDKKSEYYAVRKSILNGAVEKAGELIDREEYSEIYLIGHSLGSVIAYDTLDRLNKEMNVNAGFRKKAEKIKGFVTFGCPLDKIAFFFDEKISRLKQPVRYAITSQLHGFKRKNFDAVVLETQLQQYFENILWLNFWTKPDPVCGHLDVYHGVENIEMDFSESGKNKNFSIKSHSLYWQSEEMYKAIIDKFGMF